MCGINGIYAYSPAAPPVDAEELLRSRECMRSRGPDAADIWIDERRRVGLGHRRLAIIDLSAAGAQPMQRGEQVIIFNGEIYNYQELRARLEAKGRTSLRIRIPRCCWRCMTTWARACWVSCAACSPSCCGMARGSGCSWRAIRTASSRCTAKGQ